MKIPIGELISKADTEIIRLNQAASTLMQYRWAWHRFEVFSSENGIIELSDEALASYLQFLATELAQGRFKEWKYKLLRKSALVLSEVDHTGTYRWKLSRRTSPNDGLHEVFRPVQECWRPCKTAHVRPVDLPTGGQRNCPSVATRSAHF